MSSSAIQSSCRLCARSMLFYPDTPQLECAACGTINYHPQPEQLQSAGTHAAKAPNALLLKAHSYRTSCYFDKADKLYTSFMAANPTSDDLHEAHWGLAMCRFGVEYVEDPGSGRILPICHFTSPDPMQDDADYKEAVLLAPDDIRARYIETGRYVDDAQRRIRELSQTMPAFDIFLCYKHSDPDQPGQATADFPRAQQMYFELMRRGYNVFFANITLKEHTGANYEAMIYHALSTSRAMLLFCSRPEYLDGAWVRSEWTRYLEFCKKDSSKKLMSLMYGMSASQLPVSISHGNSVEVLNMQDAFGFNYLTTSLKNHFGARVDEMLDDARAALAQGSWAAAEAHLSKARGKIDPASQRSAYSSLSLYSLLAKLRLNNPEALTTCGRPFTDTSEWQNAYEYAAPEQQVYLESLIPSADAIADRALQAARTALENGHWIDAAHELESAAKHINATQQRSKYSDLSLCQLLVKLQLNTPEELRSCDKPFTETMDWQRAWEYADPAQRKYLQSLLPIVVSRALDAAKDALEEKRWKDAARELEIASHSIDAEEQRDDFAMLNVYRLMAQYQLSHCTELARCDKPVESTAEWKAAVSYASAQLREQMNRWLVDLPALLEKLGLSADFNSDKTEATLNACCTRDAALTSLVLPEGVVAITTDAFCDCINLQHLRLPHSLRKIDHGVIDCSRPGFVVEMYDDTPLHENPFLNPTTGSIRLIPTGAATLLILDDLLLQDTGNGSLAVIASMSQKTKLVVPNGVTVIRTNAFSTLTAKSSPSIVLPPTVTTIENGAFANNPHLKTIRLSDQLTTIGASAFAGCSGLLEIRLPASVREMGGSAFSGCSAMTTAVLSPSLVKISPFTFHGCTALTHVDIPDSVPAIGDSAFKNCSALSKLRLPANLESLGRAAFNGCVNLTEITIPKGVTTLPDSLFMSCKSLAKAEFAGLIETVASNAFSGCVCLQKLSFQQGLLVIGDSAFQNCTMLRKLTLPQSVHTFGTGVLYGVAKQGVTLTCPRNCPAEQWGRRELLNVNPGGINPPGAIFGRLLLLPLRTLLHLLILLVPLTIIGFILQDWVPFSTIKESIKWYSFPDGLFKGLAAVWQDLLIIYRNPNNSMAYIITMVATVVIAILLVIYLFFALRFVFWRKKKKPGRFAATAR